MLNISIRTEFEEVAIFHIKGDDEDDDVWKGVCSAYQWRIQEVANLIIRPNLPENLMKMKNIGPRGGVPKICLGRSATAYKLFPFVVFVR